MVSKGTTTTRGPSRSFVGIVIVAFCLTAFAGYHVGLMACAHQICNKSNILNPLPPHIDVIRCEQDNNNNKNSADNHQSPRFPDSIHKIAVGMTLVPRADFTSKFDMGVPLQQTKPGNDKVLILYSKDAQPTNDYSTTQQGDVPLIADSNEATANCDFLNVILTDVGQGRRQCVAIVGQHESFHIQRWMRIPPNRDGTVDSKAPLEYVGRLMDTDGSNDFHQPDDQERLKHWELIRIFMNSRDAMLKKLYPIAHKIARMNTLVVMFSNHGQSELIINFCCNARARNLDISGILVFATDLETKELLEGLGLTVFYDEHNFGGLPSKAAASYGDQTFQNMMMGKLICLQLSIMLGHDILFQDADVVWFKDPLPFFQNKSLSHFDVMAADDGNGLNLYLPYRANSGYFYIRNSAKTKSLINSLFFDYSTKDEQCHLNHLMAEFASRYGLRVKILDQHMFPTGVVFHHDKSWMKLFMSGTVEQPFMFHMSWTISKKEKLLYFKQMGAWFVKDTCVGITTNSTLMTMQHGSLTTSCCAAQPLISCHYHNLPSVIECNGTEKVLMPEERSFW